MTQDMQLCNFIYMHLISKRDCILLI